MVGPDYKPPEPQAPDQWHVTLTEGLSEEHREPSAWWQAFGDEQLDELILQAETKNLHLRTAASRIELARAQHGIAAADLYPSLNAGGRVIWHHRADDRRVSDILPDNNYIAALDMSWEIDLFGRVRRSMQAAEANVQASVEDWRDVLVTIRAEVAQSYIAVRANQEEARLLREGIRTQRETLELVTQKYEAGVATDLELARAQASLDEVESRLPEVETRIARSINRISVLIGEAPGPLREKLGEPGPLPAPPADIAVGIPADVIRQRPDIRAAERHLASETALIGVAVANLYPRLKINGAIGFESTSFSQWFEGDNWSGGIGPVVSWPLFDGGAVLANIRATDLEAQQALFAYELRVLHAFEEVENVLIAYSNTLLTQRHLQQLVAAHERVVALSSQRFDAGVEDAEELLRAQRALLDAQLSLARADSNAAGNVVSLYKALGGDWQMPPGPEPVEEEKKEAEEAGQTRVSLGSSPQANHPEP